MKKYIALWHESDEDEQWIATDEFEDIDSAKVAAFKGATKGPHLYAEVTEYTYSNGLWDETGEWINHCDFKNTWSGWIDGDKYRELYT